jgi:hypothetical protein
MAAAASLDDYTDEGRQIILAEAARRGLNVAPLVGAAASIEVRGRAESARCAYCNTRIFFGGKREGSLQFCNDGCRQGGVLLAVSRQVPETIVREQMWAVFKGSCSNCGGPGPVDVHVSHRVVSAIVVTSWTNQPALTCRRCGVRAKVRDSIVSLAFGWWALPWGIVMTPVQVARNVAGLLRAADESRPSTQLETMVRLRVATDVVAAPPDSALEPTRHS